MIFLKTFNNSAALVKDDDGKEEIVLGKGVGFGLKKGQEIDESKIERRFVTTENSDEIKQVKGFRSQTIDITNKVIEMVEPLLQTKFTDYQFLALADHIDFAITRINDNIDIDPAKNDWEVKNLFPKEYVIAAKVITLINAELGIKLPKSETTFMTYHLVNAASDDAQVQETMQITKLISGIINIIQFQYQITINTTSFSYSRFITHLRILLVRLLRRDKKRVLNLIRLYYPLLRLSTIKLMKQQSESRLTYIQKWAGH